MDVAARERKPKLGIEHATDNAIVHLLIVGGSDAGISAAPRLAPEEAVHD